MPDGLQLVTSNRLEALADQLAGAVRTGLTEPLANETVVVQSLGMARWLQLELARRNGVCARIRFPFPKVFIQEVCHAVVPEARGAPDLDRESLTWRVWAALAPDPWASALAEPLRYAGADPRRRFQLAARVAGLFDQYLVYRPELIAAWDAGQEDHWQAALWRTIGGGSASWPQSRLLATAAGRLQESAPAGLPQRIAVFGIPALPPVYLELLAALATHREVTLYQLQPCREFWADAVTSREEQRQLRRAGRRADQAASLHLERGNRLLASLGRLGRGFLAQLAEQGAGGDDDRARVPFADPGADTLLRAVQSDLLQMRQRGPTERLPLRPGDASLRVHSCHGPRRELEVLHDQLLEALEADPSLSPRDILVLMPDIEAYAPLIQAVFGARGEDCVRLPFSIADQVPRAESPLADTFLRLLRLPGGRFGRNEILPFLEVPALQRRFGLKPAQLSQLREWLGALRVNWGLDAAQRGELGLPALLPGTWRQGADRLLLGYAMAPGDEIVLEGISPFTSVEGEDAELAGRIAGLVAALGQLTTRLAADRTLAEWSVELEAVLDVFFAADPDSEADFALVRSSLVRLSTTGLAAGFAGVVPLAAVVEQLGPWLGEERRAGGFLRGGITFAALKPMRSVPARFLAVLGLDDGKFPRRANPLSFDLIAAHPRAGDEAREDDDRYLFLETLLSARDQLHLSHVGQSLRDNDTLPPSVVLSELLDQLAETVAGGEDEVKRRVVVRHPLHPFSPAYFGGSDDSRLFSYSRENSRAAGVARQLAAIPDEDEAFGARPLAEPEGSWRVLEVTILAKFLANPAQYFLRQRLGLWLPEAEESPEDREVFALDPLSAFQIKADFLQRARTGRPTENLTRRLEADGALPLGPAGALAAREIVATVDALVAALSPDERAAEPPEPVALTLGDFSLVGQVSERTRAGLRIVRPGKFKVSELLRLWVGQLVLAARAPGAEAAPARLVTEDECWRVKAPSDPRAVLAVLLELYAAGLRRPLPFFPKAAWEFTAPASERTRSTPLDRALAQWSNNPRRPGEEADAAFAFCFGAVRPHPLDAEFARLAERVMVPLRACAEKEDRTA